MDYHIRVGIFLDILLGGRCFSNIFEDVPHWYVEIDVSIT